MMLNKKPRLPAPILIPETCSFLHGFRDDLVAQTVSPHTRNAYLSDLIQAQQLLFRHYSAGLTNLESLIHLSDHAFLEEQVVLLVELGVLDGIFAHLRMKETQHFGGQNLTQLSETRISSARKIL